MIKTNYGFKQNKICKQIMEGNEVVITQQLAWRLATPVKSWVQIPVKERI